MADPKTNGRLKVNAAKVKNEARLNGKYLIATSNPHISAEDLALGYKKPPGSRTRLP